LAPVSSLPGRVHSGRTEGELREIEGGLRENAGFMLGGNRVYLIRLMAENSGKKRAFFIGESCHFSGKNYQTSQVFPKPVTSSIEDRHKSEIDGAC
jgi:hypothetical protein